MSETHGSLATDGGINRSVVPDRHAALGEPRGDGFQQLVIWWLQSRELVLMTELLVLALCQTVIGHEEYALHAGTCVQFRAEIRHRGDSLVIRVASGDHRQPQPDVRSVIHADQRPQITENEFVWHSGQLPVYIAVGCLEIVEHEIGHLEKGFSGLPRCTSTRIDNAVQTGLGRQ